MERVVDNPGMPKAQRRGEDVRRFILESVWQGDEQPSVATQKRFGISRQAVSKHIGQLLEEGKLLAEGETRARRYSLAPLVDLKWAFQRAGLPPEDEVWNQAIQDQVRDLSKNVQDILHFGFTEMLNNVLDHSESEQVVVIFARNAVGVRLSVIDDGVGVFNKLMHAFGFDDVQHVALELSKGKLTTDPANHSGQGLFFTSKMFDSFLLISSATSFYSGAGKEVWIEEEVDEPWVSWSGTGVQLSIGFGSELTTKAVFDRYTASADEDFAFDKTVVPVRLARMGGESLVSRSQAKRLLARVDKFDLVQLDFTGVDEIGQAFADEIFRVFQNRFPSIQLVPENTTRAVEQMISRARSARSG